MHHAKSASATLMRLWGNSDRLTQIHFCYTLLAAFILHLTIYGIWLLTPRDQVMDVPVRVLNIKLGDSDDNDQDNAQPNRDNTSSVENIISKVVHEAQNDPAKSDVAVKAVEKAFAMHEDKKMVPARLEKMMATKSKPFDMRAEGVATAAPVMSVVEKQYVRETAPGSPLGNSTTSNAEVMARYEQLISSWIDKFKPDKLMVSGQPDKVTASVRIRIDRRGNIRYMELEQSSKFIVLDSAALDTVRRANPVPAAPADYPAGESIEFIVPIVFTK